MFKTVHLYPQGFVDVNKETEQQHCKQFKMDNERYLKKNPIVHCPHNDIFCSICCMLFVCFKWSLGLASHFNALHECEKMNGARGYNTLESRGPLLDYSTAIKLKSLISCQGGTCE